MPTALNIASPLPGRSGSWDANGLIVELIEEYQILQAFNGAQPNLVGMSGLPQPQAAHATFGALLVTGYNPREDKVGKRWVVEVRYGRFGLVTGSCRRIKREWGYVEASRDLSFDAGTGAPILNVNGNPFERVPQVFHSDPRVTIVRLENSTPATVMAYNGTINSGVITVGSISIPRHSGLIRITVRETDPTGAGSPTYKYEVTYDVQMRENIVLYSGTKKNIGWDEAVVERGYYVKIGPDLKRAVETIDLGADYPDDERYMTRPTADPVLLAADGTLVTDGADAVVSIFQAIPDADWSSLNLNL